MTVFVLQHVHSFEDGTESVKFVGVYSSQANAEQTITRLSQSPGFCENRAGFCIDEYELDKDQWLEGYATVMSEGSRA